MYVAVRLYTYEPGRGSEKQSVSRFPQRGNLQLAWFFSTGVVRGHEAAPIIANNTMYIITPYPNIVYAIDLTQPGADLRAARRERLEPAP